jgi:hypothetical protein
MIAASPGPEHLPAISFEVEGEMCSKAFLDQLSTSADPVGSTHRPFVELFGSPLRLHPDTAKPTVPSPAKIQSP